jgi:hypothetical protein
MRFAGTGLATDENAVSSMVEDVQDLFELIGEYNVTRFRLTGCCRTWLLIPRFRIRHFRLTRCLVTRFLMPRFFLIRVCNRPGGVRADHDDEQALPGS